MTANRSWCCGRTSSTSGTTRCAPWTRRRTGCTAGRGPVRRAEAPSQGVERGAGAALDLGGQHAEFVLRVDVEEAWAIACRLADAGRSSGAAGLSWRWRAVWCRA